MLYNPANSASYTYTTQNVRLCYQAFSFCTNQTPYVGMCVYIHPSIPSLGFGLCVDHTSQYCAQATG